MCVERSSLASCADDVVYSYISNAMNAFCFASRFDREFLGSLELGAWTTVNVWVSHVHLPCPSLTPFSFRFSCFLLYCYRSLLTFRLSTNRNEVCNSLN